MAIPLKVALVITMLTRTLPAPARALSGGLRVAAPRLSPHMSVPVAPRLVRAHAGDGGAGDQAKQAVRDLQQGASRGTEDVKSAAEDTRGKVKQTASDAGSQSEGALKQAKDKVSQTAKDTQAGVQVRTN